MKKSKNSRKLNFAIMGMGLQGQRLARAIQASKNATLVAMVSERERGSFDAVLKNKAVDAIAIATPNDRHAAQIIQTARAGKHILCEKPLVLSMQEARTASQAIKKKRVCCFVDFHLRMHPEVQKARTAIAQKKLGDISYIEMQWSIGGLAGKTPPLPRHMRWREDPRQSGGGALMARGVHLFDLLRFLTGKEVSEVRAWSDADRAQVDRTAIGMFLLDKKTPAMLTTSKAIHDADNRIVIYGTKGKLTLRNLFTDETQTLYRAVFDAFAEALAGKKISLATLEDGIAVVAITEAFNRSVQTKRAVQIRR